LPKEEARRMGGWKDHREDFVKNAAHELRTPVSAISSAIEVLQQGAKDDPAARERFLGHIELATGRLERLVDALLVLARAQSGEEEPAVSTVPLEPILKQVFAGVVPHVGVALETECSPDLKVVTNPRLVEQLLANLVANAAKHTDSGSIRLVAERENNEVSIVVRDTGHGIEPKDRELIARELARRESPEIKGLGIGLTIVREAVRVLGGTVEIQPRTGGGTTARVTLPSTDGAHR
jgi:two-component system, OmpR family, phosphate regulon sensor histidine kinase PhoR